MKKLLTLALAILFFYTGFSLIFDGPSPQEIAQKGIQVYSEPVPAYSEFISARGGKTFSLPLTFTTENGQRVQVFKGVSHSLVRDFSPNKRYSLKYLPENPQDIVVVGDERYSKRTVVWSKILGGLFFWGGGFVILALGRSPKTRQIPAALLAQMEPKWQQALTKHPDFLTKASDDALYNLVTEIGIAMGKLVEKKDPAYKKLPPAYTHIESVCDYVAGFQFSKWNMILEIENTQNTIVACRYFGMEKEAKGLEAALKDIAQMPVLVPNAELSEGFIGFARSLNATHIFSEAYASAGKPMGFGQYKLAVARFMRANPDEFLV